MRVVRLVFMALGKRKPLQDELFIPTAKLSTGPVIRFIPNSMKCWARRSLTSRLKTSARLITRMAVGLAFHRASTFGCS